MKKSRCRQASAIEAEQQFVAQHFTVKDGQEPATCPPDHRQRAQTTQVFMLVAHIQPPRLPSRRPSRLPTTRPVLGFACAVRPLQQPGRAAEWRMPQAGPGKQASPGQEPAPTGRQTAYRDDIHPLTGRIASPPAGGGRPLARLYLMPGCTERPGRCLTPGLMPYAMPLAR